VPPYRRGPPMSEIPEAIIRYLAARDAERDRHVNRALDALSERERNLVREAAVMGYVQGVQATHAREIAIPKDEVILWRVVAGCQTFDDLYPTIGALADEGDRRG